MLDGEHTTVFRDFIYLDTDRVQSIIAQLQEGLLDQVIEGEAEEISGQARGALNLLAFLVPFNASATVGAKDTADFSQSKVLHDYAFETALRSLREKGFIAEHPKSIPEDGFVLVSGLARILDYETMSSVTGNWDGIDEFFNPAGSAKAKKDRKNSHENRMFREAKVVIDTFFKDAIRIKLSTVTGHNYIGPLAREHLREDLRSLIFKYGANPKGEWTILGQLSRPPVSQDVQQELSEGLPVRDEQDGAGTSEHNEGPVSGHLDSVADLINDFQDFLSAPARSEAIVAPIAIFRELKPRD